MNRKYGCLNRIKVVMKDRKGGGERILWVGGKVDYVGVKVWDVEKKRCYGLVLSDYKGGRK